MFAVIYENHRHPDPEFPIIFHKNICVVKEGEWPFHWHESIEIIYVIDGNCKIICDSVYHEVKAGEMFIINPNQLHMVYESDYNSHHHCLIIHPTFYDRYHLFSSMTNFKHIIFDDKARTIINGICDELSLEHEYYKSAISNLVSSLLIHLYRYYLDSTSPSPVGVHKKVAIVRPVIDYLYSHFKEQITIDDLASAMGFNKYYLCHTFKEVTGTTILEYTNFIRCSYAKSLLKGDCSVSECAYLSGFQNLSYFTRTYKRFFDVSPSMDRGKNIEARKRHSSGSGNF